MYSSSTVAVDLKVCLLWLFALCSEGEQNQCVGHLALGWLSINKGFFFYFLFFFPLPHVISPPVSAKFGHAARPGKLLNQGGEYDNYLSITDFQETPFYSEARTV